MTWNKDFLTLSSAGMADRDGAKTRLIGQMSHQSGVETVGDGTGATGIWYYQPRKAGIDRVGERGGVGSLRR